MPRGAVARGTAAAKASDQRGWGEGVVGGGRAAFGGLWAELSRAGRARSLQVLIERGDSGTEGLRRRCRDKGLAQMVAEVGTRTGKSRREAA